jgi:AraC-like DNA-binding protein
MQFSTDGLPEHDRIATWREIYGRTLLKLDVEALPGGPFHSSATLRALPGLGMVSGFRSGARYARTHELIDTDDFVFIAHVEGRGIAVQRGREVTLADGDATLLWSAEVGASILPSASRYVTLRIPYTILAPMISDLDVALVRPIPRNAEALRLLLGYVGTVQDRHMLATTELQRLVVGHVYDLAALAIGASRDAFETAKGRGLRAARLVMIQREIDRSFTDPAFSLASLAHHAGVSPRYVQMLLAEAETSFADEVTERRTRRARDMLASPRHAHRKVINIAFECGFSTVSHFHRIFRRRFGRTPGEVRAQGSDRDTWIDP